MKLSSALLLVFATLQLTCADSTPWERIDKSKALLLIVDMQVGLYSVVRDWDANLYRNAMIAHGALGKAFGIPVIMTTSAQQGPNGALAKEFLSLYPDAPLIKRQGEVDAWDNADFRAAVKATNRTQIIMAGIVTDVCTTFLACSLREAGYSVWANAEASGTTTEFIRDISNNFMLQQGIKVVSLFYIFADLLRDWRNVPGAPELYPYMDQYLPGYAYVARAHAGALENGTLAYYEEPLIDPNVTSTGYP